MELTHKEKVLVDRLIQHIKKFHPQAVMKIANETLEHEDILLLVYTDKPALETIQYITPCTLDILMNEGLHIVVLPEDKDRAEV